MIERKSDVALVRSALRRSRIVALLGPRQCGKTTRVRDLVTGNREFITMDDDMVLAAARSDPNRLVRTLDRTTTGRSTASARPSPGHQEVGR